MIIDQIITLESVILEAENKIDATPERVGQSRVRNRRGDDYTNQEEDEPEEEETPAEDETDDGTTETTDDDTEDEEETQEDDDTDYTEQEQDDEPEEEETPSEDTGSDDSTDTDDGGETDTGDTDADDTEDDSTDYTDAGDDDSGEDSGEEDTSSDDSSYSDSGSGEPQSVDEIDKKNKQLILMEQMNKLYLSIRHYITIIAAKKDGNVFFATIQNRVVKNFQTIQDLMYRYIIFYFNVMDYQYNLYMYNYFMEAIRVNFELLGKIENKEEVVY